MRSFRSFTIRATLTTMLAGFFLGTGVFLGVRLAHGDPGGATRHALTYSGVLRDASGALPTVTRTTSLTFTFAKSGATCSPPATSVVIAIGGAFTAQVPIDWCPGFFDGSDVTYTVAEGSTMLTPTPVPISPVPYARFADQVGVNNECPAGYSRDATESGWIVCVRTVTLNSIPLRDEVVKVGDGASAFWIDRYEASVHHGSTGVQLGRSNSTTAGAETPYVDSSGLLVNGRHETRLAPARALSHAGYPTAIVTWFQANEACRRSGKRLPTGDEWLAAASGTNDDATSCNVGSGGTRAADPTNRCVSSVGAHDMIGNLLEWTREWYAGAGGAATLVNSGVQNWPSGSEPSSYGEDGTWNVNGAVNRTGGVAVGIPAAALRGGARGVGNLAGVFALNLSTSPSAQGAANGFRCVVEH